MDERADRAEIVRDVFTIGPIGRCDVVARGRAGDRCGVGRGKRDMVEMHVAERNGELERDRK